MLKHSTHWNKGHGTAPLERDKNAFGGNCHLHGYSHNPDIAGSRAGAAWSDDRTFAKFAVKTAGASGCTNGICTLSASNSDRQVCHHADQGAPITCGPHQKVTYLAIPDVTQQSGCTREIRAYHVPHMIDRIDEQMKRNLLQQPSFTKP